MQILVTGCAGFVGSHLVEHLIHNTDHDIVGLDSFRHRGDCRRVDDLLPEDQKHRYRVFGCDLACPISRRLERLIGYVDVIYHLASESHVDRSIDDPVPFVQNNINATLYMLEFARKQRRLRAFFQISTDEVYGAALPGIDHKEWSTILPSNPYSASKAAQEALAISYWRTYDVPVVITNTMNMIGERQDNEKFLPMIIGKIQRGETVQIHGTEDFIGTRFYLHARNHADALIHLLSEPVTRYHDTMDEIIKPSRWNVVGEKEINNLELARLVARHMRKELKFELVDFHGVRPGHDRRYALDGSKLAATGWKAPVPLEESIYRTIDWTLARPEWMES